MWPSPTEPEPEESPEPEPTAVPATGERTTAARFAVGDLVFRDVNRSGVHDANEPAAAGISVQLLDSDGDVLDSTVTSDTGHYSFDNLEAGTYSVRFAGIPEGSRLAPTGSGNDPRPIRIPTTPAPRPCSPLAWTSATCGT